MTVDNKIPPTLSFVTPSWNQGSFLEETIKSILCQEVALYSRLNKRRLWVNRHYYRDNEKIGFR
jgi:hypothetical protein